MARSDARIRLVTHPERRGAQAARNTGIRASSSPWVAFLDSDDEWLPRSLGLRLALSSERDADVVYSDYLIADGVREPYRADVPGFSGDAFASLLGASAPTFPSLLVARDALERIGPLDETIVSFQEWDTSIRLAERARFAFLEAPTFIWWTVGGSRISSDPLRSARGYEQVVTKHRPAIVGRVGPSALKAHYREIARWYGLAGKRGSQLKYRGRSLAPTFG
jgi:glycosyltransferase involved in cell wall biosynthesis